MVQQRREVEGRRIEEKARRARSQEVLNLPTPAPPTVPAPRGVPAPPVPVLALREVPLLPQRIPGEAGAAPPTSELSPRPVPGRTDTALLQSHVIGLDLLMMEVYGQKPVQRWIGARQGN